ncbi:MAG: undecaprenyl-phosphate glucose phosphotransferase [Pseudomonadota bacterium]
MAETRLTNVDDLGGEGVKRRGPIARALFGDIVQFADFVLIISTSVAVALIYHVLILRTPFEFHFYAAAGIFGATGLTALLRRDDYYDFDQLLSPTGMLRPILYRWVLVVMGLIAFGFALKISDNFSRVWLFVWSLAAMSAMAGARFAAMSILKAMSKEGGAFARRVAVVGATPLAAQFVEHVRRRTAGVSIIGTFDAGGANGCDAPSSPFVGDLVALEVAARHGEIDDIIIAADPDSRADMDRLISRLSALPVSISICPNEHWLHHTGGAISEIGGASVLSLYRRPLEGWGGVFKTLEDWILGWLFLLAAAPIMLAVVIAIKLEGKGPIFFTQKRHGFNHAVFKIIKFRTMTVAEDGDEITQAVKNDPRVTRVGKFLRRYSLDELPQLFNVILGDMSLVGPRPHAMAHNHKYAQTVENYSGRHKVKPGITGWAQVNGFRGETSENQMMEQRVHFDLAYVDNWSIWFDLKILFMTFWAVVFPKNAN